MQYDSSSWTGQQEERKLPSITELIDKYVPMRTRAWAFQQATIYEEQIGQLLNMLREYHERCEAMTKHMHGMEEEYYNKVAIRVPLGSMEASVHHIPDRLGLMEYQVTWRPEPQTFLYRVAQPINEEEHPHLHRMLLGVFRRNVIPHMEEYLTREFSKLYSKSFQKRMDR